MSFPSKNLRSSLKNVSNKDMAASVKKRHKILNADMNDKNKRSAENSPEEGPDRKRSVFGDLTNAVVNVQVINTGKNIVEKRITRSQSGSYLKLSQESQHHNSCQEEERQQKLKRTSGITKTSNNNQPKSSENESLNSDFQETTYESASESLNSSLDLLSSSSTNSVKDSVISSSIKENVIPEGVTDFDQETAKDPFSVPSYAPDIFRHLKEREVKFVIKKYMQTQIEISKYMRSVLVDWMAEVQESFELNHETLYLAVKLLDMYLAKEVVSKANLQLVGSTALFVAAKYDERCPPALSDFIFICDDAYNQRQLIRMEIKLLKCIDFDLGAPLSYTFLRRYARCSKQTMELLTLARYILELSLLEYDFVDVKDSMMAAAALCLAMKMSNMESWNPTLEYYSGYKCEELCDLVCSLNKLVAQAKNRAFQTIPTKYSHKVFFEVANISALDDCSL